MRGKTIGLRTHNESVKLPWTCHNCGRQIGRHLSDSLNEYLNYEPIEIFSFSCAECDEGVIKIEGNQHFHLMKHGFAQGNEVTATFEWINEATIEYVSRHNVKCRLQTK